MTRLRWLGRNSDGIEARLDALERRIAAEEEARDRSLRSGLDWLRGWLMKEVGRTRSRLAVSERQVLDLFAYRASPEYAALFANPRPLVSVTISTYNRAEILVGRSLASVLRQDYDNFEVIVVDDMSSDDTEQRVRALADPRIHFVRMTGHVLPPGLGAGIEARNLALTLAGGDFITHLDDDDEYEPDRIRKLVQFARDERAELVWHPFWWQEKTDQPWTINDASEMEFAQATTSSVFYMGWLKSFTWDLLSWLWYAEPDDWTLFRTLRDMGVVMRRHPEPLLRHYKEGQNPRWAEAPGSVGTAT